MKGIFPVSVVSLVVVVSLAVIVSFAAPLSAAVSNVVPFQGAISGASDGAHNLRFSLWDGPAGAQNVTDEAQTFTTATVTLAHHPLSAGSVVVKSSNGSVTYHEGATLDFTVDYANGTITRTTGSSVQTGQTVAISYQWTYTSSWGETQTVQVTHGLFCALLGVNTGGFPGGWLTGNDYVQVEVESGAPGSGAYQTLLPRVQLGSAPAALRVQSLDGASGGSISGGLTATGQLSGTGSSTKLLNRPFVFPGVTGTGVTGIGGEAPGILAVGANSGTGTALRARGSVMATQVIHSDTALDTTGDITGASLTVTGDVGAQNVNTAGTVSAGNLKAAADVSASGNVTAKYNVQAQGRFVGVGALKPDYDSGTLYIGTTNPGVSVTLPTSLGSDPTKWLIDLSIPMVASNGSSTAVYSTNLSPGPLAYEVIHWADGNNSALVMVLGGTPPSSRVPFRLRIWVTP